MMTIFPFNFQLYFEDNSKVLWLSFLEFSVLVYIYYKNKIHAN
jgi:hypothetical protein